MGIVFHGILNIWNVYYISGYSSLGWAISPALLYVFSFFADIFFVSFVLKSTAHWSIFLITVLKSLWDTFYIWVISAPASLDYLSSFRWEVYWFLVWLLLLLLSRFSRVRLCATPQTAAHQAPPSLGFSRQEHWSGLPFPPPMHESEKWKWSRSVVSDS